jgi:uncharacterized protein YcsI (UPF0317 family)
MGESALSRAELTALTPEEVRAAIRQGRWQDPTSSLAQGYAQANMVILPQAWAYDFLIFCYRNPKPCPLMEVTDPGNPCPTKVGDRADLRTDLPRYRVFREGEFCEEVSEISEIWRSDFVAFLLGCSFTFESAMIRAGLPVRHLEEGRNVPMYVTSLGCRSAGSFQGPMVVSMRPMHQRQVVRCIEVTARYPLAHGAPVHIGNPEAIGVRDLARPDYGDNVTIEQSEIPLFWGCGVTPQVIAKQARPEIMITHSPGHMFITDLRDEDLLAC